MFETVLVQSYDWTQQSFVSLNFIESLILAQDERWRRALYMQVIRPAPLLMRLFLL